MKTILFTEENAPVKKIISDLRNRYFAEIIPRLYQVAKLSSLIDENTL